MHGTARPRAATGRAPGKVILAGEHAVVYHRPALALPWPAVEAVAEATPATGPLTLASARAGSDRTGLRLAAAETLQAIGAPATGLAVFLRSSIPPGAGLGSSAATAVAVVRAVAAAYGEALAPAALLGLVDHAERHAHGRSSGLDAGAVTAAGPIVYRRGEASRDVAMAAPPALVVAHSGRPRDTRAAVAIVAASLAQAPAAMEAVLDALGQAALDGAAALEAGDMPRLGALMNQAQAGLATLGVSDAGLDALIVAARQAGALGAKLTGAGRGGCVVALAAVEAAAPAIARALLAAGATQAWTKEGPA